MSVGEQRFTQIRNFVTNPNFLKTAAGLTAAGMGLLAFSEANKEQPSAESSLLTSLANRPSVTVPDRRSLFYVAGYYQPFSPPEDLLGSIESRTPAPILQGLREALNYLCQNESRSMTLADLQSWMQDNTKFQAKLRERGIRRVYFLGEKPVVRSDLTDTIASSAVSANGESFFDRKGLQERFGSVQDMQFKLGDEIGMGRVTFGEGATDVKNNFYSNSDTYWPMAALYKARDTRPIEENKEPVDAEAIREKCCQMTFKPPVAPPRQPVAPPRVVVVPSATPTPTEVPPTPSPVLPWLTPFTPVPPPGQPGQPGGQPGPGPGPGPGPAPETATPGPGGPTNTPETFPTATTPALQSPVTTYTPVAPDQYVPPTERPNQNTPVTQPTRVPEGTQAALQTPGDVRTPVSVSSPAYVPPTERPRQNTPVTQPARSGTAQSPQTRMIMIDRQGDKQVYWLTWEK